MPLGDRIRLSTQWKTWPVVQGRVNMSDIIIPTVHLLSGSCGHLSPTSVFKTELSTFFTFTPSLSTVLSFHKRNHQKVPKTGSHPGPFHLPQCDLTSDLVQKSLLVPFRFLHLTATILAHATIVFARTVVVARLFSCGHYCFGLTHCSFQSHGAH